MTNDTSFAYGLYSETIYMEILVIFLDPTVRFQLRCMVLRPLAVASK